MVLDKKDTLFDRDEDGNLVAQEVELVIDETNPEQKKYEGETIYVTPLMRGELRRLVSEMRVADDEKDLDADIIIRHCKKPSYTEEEIKYLKGPLASSIVNTILSFSGVDVDRGQSRADAIEQKEDEFAKN